MKMVNSSELTLRFKTWGAPGEPETCYVVEPGATCKVPDGYCVAAKGRKSAIAMKAPSLQPYTEPAKPEPTKETPVFGPKPSRKRRGRRVKGD